MKCFSVDVCVYSSRAFLIVMLILIHAFYSSCTFLSVCVCVCVCEMPHSTCTFLSVCVKCLSVDVCIYSTCAFLGVVVRLFVMLILMYAFIVLMLY